MQPSGPAKAKHARLPPVKLSTLMITLMIAGQKPETNPGRLIRSAQAVDARVTGQDVDLPRQVLAERSNVQPGLRQ